MKTMVTTTTGTAKMDVSTRRPGLAGSSCFDVVAKMLALTSTFSRSVAAFPIFGTPHGEVCIATEVMFACAAATFTNPGALGDLKGIYEKVAALPSGVARSEPGIFTRRSAFSPHRSR